MQPRVCHVVRNEPSRESLGESADYLGGNVEEEDRRDEGQGENKYNEWVTAQNFQYTLQIE